MKTSRLKNFLEAVQKVRSSLDDETAATVPEMFREWTSGKEFAEGERVVKDGVLYVVLQNHVSQSTWVPENTPSLFAVILPGQSGTEIGEWVQPDSTNPYMAGDRVTYDGKTWESTIDNNVWSPGVYGWIEV